VDHQRLRRLALELLMQAMMMMMMMMMMARWNSDISSR